MKKIRVGVIGQGRSGYSIHSNAIATCLGNKFELVAVADLELARCKDAQERTGCRAYTDYRQMLKECEFDLVVDSLLSECHSEVNIELLQSGVNVLGEKPFAASVELFDKQIAAAKQSGKKLFAFQQSRFAAAYRKICEVVDSGVLGRIVEFKIRFNGFARRWDWQTLQRHIGGNLWNTGPHPLDQAVALFGSDPETIFCRMDRANTWGDAEDQVKLIFTSPGKMLVDLEISSCCTTPTPMYQIFGTRGGLCSDGCNVRWKYFLESEAPKQKLIETPLPDRGYCSEELPFHEEEWKASAEEIDYFYNISALYNNIYDVLVNGGTEVVQLDQVRRQIRIIEECHRQNPLSRLDS